MFLLEPTIIILLIVGSSFYYSLTIVSSLNFNIYTVYNDELRRNF